MELDWTWKDKILDYEIETWKGVAACGDVFAWKDKILDYEIETWNIRVKRLSWEL